MNILLEELMKISVENDDTIDSRLDLLIGLKVILLGPNTNIEKLSFEIEDSDSQISMYVTLDCSSLMILNPLLGQPVTLLVISLS